MLNTRVLVPIAGALILFVGCSDPTTAERQLAAQKAIEKGHHSEALIELKTALQVEPKSGELRFMLGSLLLDTGDPASAELELRKAVDEGYKGDAITASLAAALVANGKFKEVTDTYAAVSLQDDAARTRLGGAVATAWLMQRSFVNARKVAAQVLEFVPDHGPSLLVMARLMAIDNKLDEALALAKRAADKGGASGEAHMLLALLLGEGKRDRAGAIAEFEQAARHPSTALNARTALVQMHAGARDLSKAKVELALLQKSHPTHANTVYLAAVLAYSEGRFDKVVALTDALLKIAPNSPQVLTLSGAGHLRRGALVAAEAKLGRVVQTVERALLARKLLAETYLRMGQADRTLATLAPFLAEANDADVLAMLAQAYLQKRQVAEAESAFKAALEIKPDDVRLRTSVAMTDLVKGKSEAAFDALRQLAEQDRGNTADLALISALLQRKEFDRALVAVDRLQKKEPKSAMPLHLRAVAMIGMADAAGARQALEAALAADPRYFAARAMLASLDTKGGNFDAAQAHAEAAIKLEPKHLGARMLLVDVLRARGATADQVLQAIDEALRTHPTEAAPHLAMLVHLGKYRGAKEAAGHAQAALAALPTNPQVLDAAGLALLAAGEEQQAIAAFNRLVSAMPQSALPYLRLSDAHARRGNHSESSAMLSRAYAAAPESADVHTRLLQQATLNRDYKQVLAVARDLQRRQPGHAVGYMLEGDAETARKGWPAAKVAYQVALGKVGGLAVAPRAYYVTLKRAGEASQAERFAAEWLKSHPNDVNLRGMLGSDALLASRLVDAQRYFSEIVAIDPSSATALNNLAWVLATRKDKGALQMAKRALAVAPRSPSVLDTVARAYEADEQLTAAIDYQRQAIEASEGEAPFRIALVGLLIKAGDKAGAAQELARLGQSAEEPGIRRQVERLRMLLRS